MVRHIPKELQFGVLLNQEQCGGLFRAVLDTGCGAGYYVGSNKLGLITQPALYTAGFVDGSIKQITEVVKVTLTVGDCTREVVLRLISNSAEEPYILFGRSLISQFDLVTDGSSVSQKGIVLDDDVKMLEDFATLEDLDEIGQSVDDDERVLFRLSSEDDFRSKDLVKSLLNEEMDLPFCPGAKMKLKELGALDIHDVPEQEYFFELTLPNLETSQETVFRNRFYSQSLYSRLSDLQRQEFDSVVESFVSKKYWIESTQGECEKICPYTANVFPVCAEGKPMRLVSDFRLLNVFYPSSTTVNRIHHPVMLLRSFISTGLVVGDAKQAFYKVRLNTPLWLTVGNKHFLCTRLAFGLSMGVEALRQSLGMVWELWKRNCRKPGGSMGFGNLWIDDFLTTQREYVPLLITMLGICGFDISRKKFQDDLFDTKFLGAVIRRDCNKVELLCDIAQRRTQLLGMISKLRISPVNVTKKFVFAIAGIIAFDVGHCHPELRMIADLMRKLIGKYKDAWEAPLTLESDDKFVFDYLLDWLERQVNATCDPHITNPVTPEAIPHFKLETDASMFAYSVVLYVRDANETIWRRIYADACVLKPARFKHHINRNEAFALLIGMRIVAMFLDFIKESRLGDSPDPFSANLEIWTDSTTALAWTRTGSAGPSTNFKTVEWRQIVMLAEALHSEYKILKSLIPNLKINHVKGSENTEADELSRLLHRQIGPDNKPLGNYFFRNKNLKLEANSDEIGKIDCEKSYGGEFLLELLARHCFNLEQLLDQLALVANLGGKDSDTASPEFYGNFDRKIWLLADRMQRVAEIKNKNKYVKIERYGFDVLCYQEVKFTGEQVDRVVIPGDSGFKRVRELVAKYFHSKYFHRGYRYDMARINESNLYLEGLTSAVRSFISKCLICARKNSHNLPKAFAMAPQTYPRELTLPAFSRISIDFIQVRTWLILTVLCIDCSVFYCVIVKALSASEAFEGLLKLSRTYSVDFRYIHSDNAQAFNTRFKTLVTQEWPLVQFSRTVPYSSHQNPTERMHKEVWSLLKSRKTTYAIEEDVGNEITQDVLQEISFVLNQRPLGVDEQQQVITPARLAWGTAWKEEGRYKLLKFREYFYREVFSIMRRKHLPIRNLRRTSVAIGNRVLFQLEDKDKHEFSHELGVVVSVDGNKISIRRKGSIVIVNSRNAIPLKSYFQVE